MATRMQQRRGTAAQWISTNSGNGPILAPGEIGYETDTNKFKIGDGTNHWLNLDYFIDANSTVNPAFGNSITFEGATADGFETTLQITDPTADRTITIPNVTGTVITTGNLSDITDIGVFSSTIVMEGSTADAHELTLSAGDPTADRTITFPDETGTVATQDYVDSAVGGAEVDQSTLAGNGISWNAGTSKFEVDTAAIQARVADVTDTEIGYLNGVTSAIQTQLDDKSTASKTETFTNKTLTSPVVSGLTLSDSGIVIEGSSEDAHETTLTVTNPTADRTITFPDETGTVQLRVTDVSDTEIGYLNGVSSAIQTQLDDKSTASKTETLTNKTLTTPTINGPTITATGQTPTIHGIYLPAPHNIIFEGTTADDFETTLQAGEPTADRTITLPDATGTVALAADVAALSGATFTGAVSGTDLTLSGNLIVNGTTTTINSTTLAVDDKNILLGDVATPTDTTADGGGITLKGATDKTFNWVDATDAWTSSEHINLASSKTLKYNGTDLVAAQSGNSGKYLTTDGTSTSWGTVSGYSAPTLGSTSIASGATVTTIAGLTLTSPTITGTPTISGSGDFLVSGDTNVRIVPAAGSNAYVGTQSATNIITTAGNTQTLTNKTLTSPTMTAPVLGTPASGTLTNATGLPISGLVASTSTALGLGSIELGHATDTTIARASAGVVTIEGVNIVTTSSTDTLTNKTLTSPTMTAPTLGLASATKITSPIHASLDASGYEQDISLMNIMSAW